MQWHYILPQSGIKFRITDYPKFDCTSCTPALSRFALCMCKPYGAIMWVLWLKAHLFQYAMMMVQTFRNIMSTMWYYIQYIMYIRPRNKLFDCLFPANSQNWKIWVAFFFLRGNFNMRSFMDVNHLLFPMW